MTERHSDDDRATLQRLVTGPSTPLDGLREAVLEAAEELSGATAWGGRVGSRSRGQITLERPPRADFGDYSTNAALLLAAGLTPPLERSRELLGSALQRRLGPSLERFEVAGPGFLNLFLADSWLVGALADVLALEAPFGAGGEPAPERMLVEFVSANPTGPMHVGHARNAAYGDALARVLAYRGHRRGA